MEYEKIIKLLDNAPNEPFHYREKMGWNKYKSCEKYNYNSLYFGCNFTTTEINRFYKNKCQLKVTKQVKNQNLYYFNWSKFSGNKKIFCFII